MASLRDTVQESCHFCSWGKEGTHILVQHTAAVFRQIMENNAFHKEKPVTVFYKKQEESLTNFRKYLKRLFEIISGGMLWLC